MQGMLFWDLPLLQALASADIQGMDQPRFSQMILLFLTIKVQLGLLSVQVSMLFCTADTASRSWDWLNQIAYLTPPRPLRTEGDYFLEIKKFNVYMSFL